MSEEEELELGRLCDAFFEGQLSDLEKEAFEQRLLESEEARRVYLRLSGMRSSLRHYASEAQSTAEPEEHELQNDSKRSLPGISIFEPMKWAASLAVAFLLGALIWNQLSPESTLDRSIEKMESTYEGMAVLIQAHDVVWAEGARRYESGDPIPAGRFKIESGLAQLEFYSGATMILEGKADLDILSEDKAYCHLGRATVSVSPHAKGFSIATPDADFVDLGTEFGLAVEPGKPSELHVFSGEVEVYERNRDAGDAPLHSLQTGDAAQFASAASASEIALDAKSFWDGRRLAGLTRQLNAKRFGKWKTFSESFAKREGVVSYFPFYETSNWVRQLENTARGESLEGNGAIVGCRWEEGRWAQKSALRFNNPSDRVRFNIPGEFESVSFAAWIKVESLKNVYNGLFMTDSWKVGNPHWQIDEYGQMILGVKSVNPQPESDIQYILYSPPVITPEVYGEWIHVASTFDTNNSQMRHYVNGKLLSESGARGRADTKVVVGSGEIGNWGLSREAERRVRNFDGAIDEMIFCSRVLSPGEIQEIFRSGNMGSSSVEGLYIAEGGGR